jgi:hypothetical protein
MQAAQHISRREKVLEDNAFLCVKELRLDGP